MLQASEISTDELVRRLADETEIRTVIARYARASDRMDMDLLRSCYHDDATDAHGTYNGDVEGFIAWSENFNKKVVAKFHQLGQSLVELDGDSAWVETYCTCYLRLRNDDGSQTDRTGVIRYVDVFERRHGEWRIARRKLVHHPGKIEPVTIETTFAEQAFLARMDSDDPSFDRRPESFLP